MMSKHILCVAGENTTGGDHPAKMVESFTLSHVSLPHVSTQLQVSAPNGTVSAFQHETARRAVASLDSVGVFVLGDGTGSGKGRVLACIAADHIARYGADVRILWMSANQTLGAYADKELHGIGSLPIVGLSDIQTAAGRVVYTTYGTLMHTAHKEQHRVISDWLSGAKVSLVLLDEAHLLRGRSKVAARIGSLIPSTARIVYCTATLMSNRSHVQYLHRVIDSAEIATLRRAGNDALETIAVSLKQKGVFLSRQLSSAGVRVRMHTHRLTPSQIELYDECVSAILLSGAGGAHVQLFLRRLLVSFKTDTAVRIAKSALRAGKNVVIAVQHTGEAAQRRSMPNSLADAMTSFGITPPPGIHKLRDVIDSLISCLGTSNVAEISGRRRRMCMDGHMDRVPSTAKACESFQSGKQNVVIISQAGSTGISLHADRIGAVSRVHICLELPWGAEELLQQCGRTHRAGSHANGVDYEVVTCDAAADLRIMSAVTKRMSVLASISCADQRTQMSPMACDTQLEFSSVCRSTIACRILVNNTCHHHPGCLTRHEIALSADDAWRHLCPGRGLPSQRVRLRHAIRTLQTFLHVPDEDRVRALCIATLKPASTFWIHRSSNTDPSLRHDEMSLPPRVRGVLTAVHALSQETTSLLYRLSDGIVDMICAHVVSSAVFDCVQLLPALETSLGRVENIVMRPPAWTLNRVMMLPFSLQRVVCDMFSVHADMPPNSSHRGVQRFEDVVSPPGCYVHAILNVEFPDENTLHVTADVRPILDGRGVFKARCGTSYAVDRVTTSRVRLRPLLGESTTVSNQEWADMLTSGCMSASHCARLRRGVRRDERTARISANTASGSTHIIATGELMAMWDKSKKKLLLCTSPLFDRTEIGLYIGTSTDFA
tara:strand:- start:66 stop:2732 length:2667 start_codon:yes stop_codon:yes gene_type:complete